MRRSLKSRLWRKRKNLGADTEPYQDPKLFENSVPDPNQIVSDPQH
jgi:hypothetical protein